MKKPMPPPTVAPGYLRPSDAAIYLGVSNRFLADLVSRRMIPSISLGRKCRLFAKSDLDKALMRFRQEAVGE
jgi:excisionase family DNA binding protein